MTTYKAEFDRIQKSDVEAVGAFAEPVYVGKEPWFCAGIATGVGAYGIGSAAVNTAINKLRSYVTNPLNYSVDSLKLRKKVVSELVAGLNEKLFSACTELSVFGCLSLTLMTADPQGNLRFVQCGNTSAILTTGAGISYAAIPQTLAAKRAGEEGVPVLPNLLETAIGINAAVTPRFTKAKLTEPTKIYLMSAGFSLDMQKTVGVLRKTASTTSAIPQIMHYIEELRGLACADACLEILAQTDVE